LTKPYFCPTNQKCTIEQKKIKQKGNNHNTKVSREKEGCFIIASGSPTDKWDLNAMDFDNSLKLLSLVCADCINEVIRVVSTDSVHYYILRESFEIVVDQWNDKFSVVFRQMYLMRI